MLNFYQNFQKFIRIGKKLAIIEHSDTLENAITVIIIKWHGNGFDIEEKISASNLDALYDAYPHCLKIPCIIGITTKQVLQRKITNQGTEVNTEALVLQAFPNLELSNFFYHILHTKDASFISVCRKTYISEIINQYTQKGYKIIHVFFGNNHIYQLKNFIPENTENIYSKTATIAYEENQIQNITKTQGVQQEYTIGEELIASKYLLSVAFAIYFLNNKNTNYRDNLSINEDLSLKHQHRRGIIFTVTTLLGILLIGLAINSLVFSSLYQKVNHYKENQLWANAQKKTVSKLQKQLQQKENLVNSLLHTDRSQSSKIVNQLVVGLPHTTLLNTIEYQPIQKKIIPKKPIRQYVNSIKITGKTTDKEAFFEWISTLKTLDSIRNLNVEDFMDVNPSLSYFTIQITTFDR